MSVLKPGAGTFIIDRTNTFRIAFCVHTFSIFHRRRQQILFAVFLQFLRTTEILKSSLLTGGDAVLCRAVLVPALVVEESLICVLFTITKLSAVCARDV